MEYASTGDEGSLPRDYVIIEGINARGFGTIPKAVMRDAELPVEAKGMYAYLCSFAGGGQTAFPSRATMLAELGMSKDRFYKYRQMLVGRGLLRIERRSEGNVAHPVRTNVYVLAATMPECYRGDYGQDPTNHTRPSVEKEEKALNPQVGNDVLETRTSSDGFPLSAGQERRPGFKDVVETRTTKRPGNQDTDETSFPSSRIASGGNIKNSLRKEKNPPVQAEDSLAEMKRDFAEISSPVRTPNRNRIHEALGSYGEVRSRFPASVIASAWERRQRDAREAGRPARFYPQLARWLEDPGPDGAASMCEAEAERVRKRESAKVAVALSLDADYMAMRSEAAALTALTRDGTAGPAEAARITELEAAMSSIRRAKAEELAGSEVVS